MKKFVFLIATALFVFTNAHAFDVGLLANNKEAMSRELSQTDLMSAQTWGDQHRLGADLKTKALKALSDTFNEMERIDTNCELGLVARLQSDAMKYGVISTKGEVLDLIAWLRKEDVIDDILYKMIRSSTYVSLDFINNAELKAPLRPFNLNTRQNAGIDLVKFYAPVKNWPDDVNVCAIDTYFEMTTQLTYQNSKDRDNQILKLNYLAYKSGVIDLATYNKLDTLRKREALNWNIYFKRYADVANNAKDKLTKTPEKKATNNFSVEYVSKREGLTQRANLYRTFDSTQIMMLAQIIEKTAKRMDAKLASLNWQYTNDPNGEREIYVLSPMEQYRAAIKMLRKDMGEVMRSDAFKNTGLDYDHLIAAAYEAGYIKSEELDYVLKFEDFWNPQTPKWKAYANFAFSIAGSASFYLPPPWNVIGAIGLVLTQTKLLNGEKKPDPDDNWNVII